MILNPTGVAPLTASLEIESDIPVSVQITVSARIDDDPDLTHRFDQSGTTLNLPVLGLYADHQNTVTATYFDENGSELGSRTYEVTTDPLLADLPTVDINTADPSGMAEGMTFAAYYGHRPNGSPTPQRPFIFDRTGEIRWYLDYSSHPELSNLFYDNGMERLENGNFFFGSNSTSKIYEINMLGEVLNSWDLGSKGFSFHHHVIEKPDGNFIATVNNDNISTVEDHVIEIDRATGDLVTVWDLNESLDNTRRAWPTDLANLDVDWFHGNALAYDEADDAILVSGRTQCVVKLSRNNEVIWILAPHKEWGTSGDGTDLTQFLLQPLDASGNPINDSAVLSGDVNHPDFEWSWYQHAVKIKPDGNIFLFDNGENRNYSGSQLYSRAVEYAIDQQAMTIQQTWSYGKQRGAETYSRIVSEVDFFPDENHVFFTPGATRFGGEDYGKVVEIDYSQQAVLFEATIIPPVPAFGLITLHRSQRLPLYPQ
ncbi:MAG: aryl-sulfate sulfotransferase [Balneolaceae bacterium]|nr:aryl-sulfate sulfotransferase [Balneolaceae bacterium]